MSQPTPVLRGDIMGVWRRVLLADGQGTEDRESIVYWVQAGHLCGDIRQHRRLSGLTGSLCQADLPSLEAFSGRLVEHDGVFCWQPTLSLLDQDGPPDEGRLSWLDGDLREEGVHRAYVERWTRVAEPQAGDFAVVLRDPVHSAVAHILQVGRYVFHARGGAAGRGSLFGLFEMRPDGPHTVLATANGGGCPHLEFSATRRDVAWLSADGGERATWLVDERDACSVAPSQPATNNPAGR